MATEVSQTNGRAVNEKRVARVMREHALQSHKRRRFRVVTTDSKHSYPAEFERRWRAGIDTREQNLATVRPRVTHRRPVPGSSQAPEPAVRG